MLNNTPRYRQRNTCEVTTTSTADLTVAATPYATQIPKKPCAWHTSSCPATVHCICALPTSTGRRKPCRQGSTLRENGNQSPLYPHPGSTMRTLIQGIHSAETEWVNGSPAWSVLHSESRREPAPAPCSASAHPLDTWRSNPRTGGQEFLQIKACAANATLRSSFQAEKCSPCSHLHAARSLGEIRTIHDVE